MAVPDPDWLAFLEPVAALARPAFEALLRAPDSAGWALIAAAVLFIALGRHGQRAVMALLGAGAAAWASRALGWSGKQGLMAPQSAAAVGLGIAAGAALPSWTRALFLGAAGAAAGAALATRLAVNPLWAALPLCVLSFVIALVNERAFAAALPSLAAGPALIAGIVRSLPTDVRGSVEVLTDVRALLLAAAAVSALLLAFAVRADARRERLRKERKSAGADLKDAAKRAAQKAVFAEAAEKARAKRTVH